MFGGGTEYSASPPEISILPAAAETLRHLEIDEHTGLPKLPVEQLPPGSPEVVRSQKDLRKVSQLASALKMASDVSSSGGRKSVTFDPAASSDGEAELESGESGGPKSLVSMQCY